MAVNPYWYSVWKVQLESDVKTLERISFTSHMDDDMLGKTVFLRKGQINWDLSWEQREKARVGM